MSAEEEARGGEGSGEEAEGEVEEEMSMDVGALARLPPLPDLRCFIFSCREAQARASVDVGLIWE